MMLAFAMGLYTVGLLGNLPLVTNGFSRGSRLDVLSILPNPLVSPNSYRKFIGNLALKVLKQASSPPILINLRMEKPTYPTS